MNPAAVQLTGFTLEDRQRVAEARRTASEARWVYEVEYLLCFHDGAFDAVRPKREQAGA